MHALTRCRSVHARGFTAGQKNCGKSGLGYWASRPPGCRAAGPLGHGPLGLWPAFSKTTEKYLLLIGFLLGDLFAYSHDQILFDDRLQYCVRGIRYLSHLGVKIYTVYKPALTHCIKTLFKIQMSVYVIGFQQERIKGTEKASPIDTLFHR